MNKAPTWFAVARRPKWIGAFFIAMGVAVICGLLAQWQGSRSIEAPVRAADQSVTSWHKAPVLSSVVKPGRTPRESAVGTQVQTQATLDASHIWVVANRIQRDGTAGFWVVGSYVDSDGNRVIATLGFTRQKGHALAVAKSIRSSMQPMLLLPLHGRMSPAEAPERIVTGAPLASLSPGQLANLLPADSGQRVYPLFLLVTDQAAPGLENITVTSLSNAQINWLSAFYAVEWSAFCGISFFMWWRLVRDEQQRELAEITSDDQGKLD
jgi:surfeit locus 1 family protein